MKKFTYVVAVYVSVVGKNRKKLEDYCPDGLSLETDDYEKAKEFYNSLDLDIVMCDWLNPNEKNYCVKVEKEIARWISTDLCPIDVYDELLEFVEYPWMRLKDESKSITETISLNEEERSNARV